MRQRFGTNWWRWAMLLCIAATLCAPHAVRCLAAAAAPPALCDVHELPDPGELQLIAPALPTAVAPPAPVVVAAAAWHPRQLISAIFQPPERA